MKVKRLSNAHMHTHGIPHGNAFDACCNELNVDRDSVFEADIKDNCVTIKMFEGEVWALRCFEVINKHAKLTEKLCSRSIQQNTQSSQTP